LRIGLGSDICWDLKVVKGDEEFLVDFLISRVFQGKDDVFHLTFFASCIGTLLLPFRVQSEFECLFFGKGFHAHIKEGAASLCLSYASSMRYAYLLNHL